MSNYKKRTPAENFRCECARTDKGYLVSIPLILLCLGIFTRWVSGSPLSTLHYIGANELIMPLWLMVLLFSLSYLVAGLALGLALGNRVTPRADRKYQGAMWFCIALALGYAWYPIFFCARLFLASVCLSILCLFASVCASICFACVSKMSLFFSILYNCWLIYLLLLNMQIFFSI